MQNELNELRNQVRTLKRVVYGAFGLMLVGGLLAATSLQSVPDVVRAKAFVLVNDEGKPFGGMYADANGGVMTVMNKDGKSVALIHVNAYGGAMGVLSKDGKIVAGISAAADGGGTMMTMDSKGQTTSTTP